MARSPEMVDSLLSLLYSHQDHGPAGRRRGRQCCCIQCNKQSLDPDLSHVLHLPVVQSIIHNYERFFC